MTVTTILHNVQLFPVETLPNGWHLARDSYGGFAVHDGQVFRGQAYLYSGSGRDARYAVQWFDFPASTFRLIRTYKTMAGANAKLRRLALSYPQMVPPSPVTFHAIVQYRIKAGLREWTGSVTGLTSFDASQAIRARFEKRRGVVRVDMVTVK